jgi:acyl CoA:acetate/3-ketoacid CoA transferase
MVNAGMGISSTMTAVSSMQGVADSIRNRNTAGVIAGLGSTALSFGMGNRALTQFASGLGGRIANATSVDKDILLKQQKT